MTLFHLLLSRDSNRPVLRVTVGGHGCPDDAPIAVILGGVLPLQWVLPPSSSGRGGAGRTGGKGRSPHLTTPQ